MMTMTLDMTSQLAPIVWIMATALLASTGILVGLSLPEAWEIRFGRATLATVGCAVACVVALLIAV